MNKQHHYNGFVKRAQQYGLSRVEADELFKQADLSGEIARLSGKAMSNILPPEYAIDPGIGATGVFAGATGAGAGLGGLTGGAMGFLGAQPNEKGNRHRVLKGIGGALGGGALGGLGGAGVGAVGAGSVLANPATYQVGAGKEIVADKWDQIKGLFKR